MGVAGSEYAVPNPDADQDKALIKGVVFNPIAIACSGAAATLLLEAHMPSIYTRKYLPLQSKHLLQS
jgi:hypothetical protein